MAKTCAICGIDSIFFIWSTSRYFRRDNIISSYPKLDKLKRRQFLKGSYPVCFWCVKRLGLMNR